MTAEVLEIEPPKILPMGCMPMWFPVIMINNSSCKLDSCVQHGCYLLICNDDHSNA